MSNAKSFALLVLAGFLPTTLLLWPAAPLHAQQAPAAADPRTAPVALVRAGDSAMTCEALAGEINTLAQPTRRRLPPPSPSIAGSASCA